MFGKVLGGICVLGILAVGSGCTATQPASAASADAVPAAVACERCETTWVKVPLRGKGTRVVGYSTRKEMACPDCTSAAENFFAGRGLRHTCSTCGPDAVKVCATH